jgi:hypothetical protein
VSVGVLSVQVVIDVMMRRATRKQIVVEKKRRKLSTSHEALLAGGCDKSLPYKKRRTNDDEASSTRGTQGRGNGTMTISRESDVTQTGTLVCIACHSRVITHGHARSPRVIHPSIYTRQSKQLQPRYTL